MSRSPAPELCPACTRDLIRSRFDATFRLSDRTERLCFAIPASLCAACHQLYVDPGVISILDLDDARCVFAIETDRVAQDRAWSSS
jgi:hypothetical protein